MKDNKKDNTNSDITNKNEKEHNKKNKLQEEIDKLKKENEELQNEVLRAKADLINYRKRKDDESNELIKYSNANLLTSILPIIDDFSRALDINESNLSPDFKNFLIGVKMINAKFLEILKANGVNEIDCLGKEFDSKLQNCVFTVDDKDKPYNTVLEVISKGYTYYDKILRCASVKVNMPKDNDNTNN